MNQKTVKLFKRVANATGNRAGVDALARRWKATDHKGRGRARQQMKRFLARVDELGAKAMFDSWGSWGKRAGR